MILEDVVDVEVSVELGELDKLLVEDSVVVCEAEVVSELDDEGEFVLVAVEVSEFVVLLVDDLDKLTEALLDLEIELLFEAVCVEETVDE